MEKPLIYLARSEDRRSFVNHVLGKVQADLVLSPAMKVMVKPNIVSWEPYPTTTHPLLLAAVLDFLLDSGCQLTVADGPAVDARNSDRILSEHPLAEICRERGVALKNLHKHGFRKVKAKSMTLEISALAFGYSYVISLPVLKSHAHCQMTGALKNQFGLLSNRERIMMHARLKSLGKGIAEVNSVLKPDFFIVDAVQTYCHTNERRHGATEATLGYLLAGRDPVALDSLGLQLLKNVESKLEGKSSQDIDYIAHAFKIGLGSIEYEVEMI